MTKKKGLLGKQGLTGYSSAEDFVGPYDIHKFIHRNSEGNVIIGQKNKEAGWKETAIPSQNATRKMLDRYREAEVDTYISAEVMYGTRRGNSKVARLCELFIDIDCDEIGLTPDKAWEIVLRDYVDAMLPCPSLVVDSGQGLQLHWLLWEHPEAMPRWKRVERYLCKALRPLGADPIAIDAARVLRMAFTMNTKSGRIAEVIAVKDVVYTLDEIIEAYGIKSDDSITTTSANENSPSLHAGDGQRDVEEKDDR